MRKNEIADIIARESSLTKKDVLQTINRFLSIVKETVIDGDKVELRGFGTFFLSEKNSRQIYSPIADKNIDVPPKAVINFKPGKSARMSIDHREGA